MPDKDILINQMYAGKYLSIEDNIGHEVINFLKADDGNRYVYITPDGKVSSSNIGTVLFVRNIHAGKTVEVIAKATELEDIEPAASGLISYDGVRLSDIYPDSTHSSDEIFATFKAGQVYEPIKPTILSLEDDDYLHSFMRLAEKNVVKLIKLRDCFDSKKTLIYRGRAQKRYIFANEASFCVHSVLLNLIRETDLWCPAETKENLTIANTNDEPSFLEIIGRTSDEKAYSNLLEYFFLYDKDSFNRFLQANGLNPFADDFTIEREHYFNIKTNEGNVSGRIDLWVESKSQLLIIENKIGSSISRDSNTSTQLDKYELAGKSTDKPVQYCLIAPDKNLIVASQLASNKSWRLIPYSILFDHYRYSVVQSNNIESSKHFPDFFRALYLQTLSESDKNFGIMLARFKARIVQFKSTR